MLSDHAMYVAKREGRNRAVRFHWKENNPNGASPEEMLSNLSANPESLRDFITMVTITNGEKN